MTTRLAIVLGSALMFVSCSNSTPRAPSSAGESDKELEEDTQQKNKPSAGKPIAVEALEWGPYLTADLPSDAKGIAWESGYISMRQIQGTGTDDLYDYRWYLSAVASGEKTLPTVSSEGCQSFPKALTEDAFVDEASFSGAFTANAEGTDIMQVAPKDKDSDFSYVAGKPLTATFKTSAGTYEEEAPGLPESHNLQLSGAYAGSLNVNTVMSVVNANLKTETNDLVLSDQGDGQSYTTAVVLFFPGSEASAGNVRCVVPAGGRVTITAADYKKWLPLKGFVAFSARTALEDTEGGTRVWKSTIRGDGVEDLEVP